MIRIRHTLLALSALTAVAGPTAATELTLTITGLAGDSGTVRAGVFSRADRFPDAGSATAGGVAPADSPSVTLVVTLPAAGRYAVAVHHDRDGDGALDRNWAGLPGEPVAFSRGATGLFGPPAFADAAVDVPAGGRGLRIRLGESGQESSE